MLDFVQAFLHPEKEIQLTDEFQSTLELLETTAHHYFVTGNAGTGKSTLIDYFRNNTKKKVAVLAPTGLSAVNVHGQTIHTFFRLPPRLITPELVQRVRYSGRMYRELDAIVIDEASMIRADLLDGIDLFLRKHGKDATQPFGGTQLILVGDLLQLPPVVTNADAAILGQFYNSPYLFSARAFQSAHFTKLELKTIFRQSDPQFVDILNQVRAGQANEATFAVLNEQVQPSSHQRTQGVIVLTATNKVAQRINEHELQQLPAPEFAYEAKVDGEFPIMETSWPIDQVLKLRVGARVLFVKNGSDWVNGTLGRVESLTSNSVRVLIDHHTEAVEVPIETWEYVRYEYDPETQKVEPQVLGRLRQYPLRLAWAITVHKSQGMTFERVHIDYTSSPFAHGQTYVALSRCKTLKGITLSHPLYPNDVIVDQQVVEYLQTGKANPSALFDF